MKFTMIYNSPLGKLNLISDGEYLTGIYFENNPIEILEKYEDNENIFTETIKWLDIYFTGEKPNFIPKYKVSNMSEFRKQVIEYISEIPYGEIVTYNDIAKKIANKNGTNKMSAQAVGGAVGWNPIPIIIPCHRVVGSNGSLIGYGGGIQNKVKLLEIEKVNMKNLYIPKKGNKI